MSVKGFRGATLLAADDAEEMADAVVELLQQMMTRNGLEVDDVISVIFTATPDLHSAFPAAAARRIGFADVPLICAQELDVTGAVERAVRILMHADSDLTHAQIQHVYLRGAEVLRQDIAQ